MAFDQDASIVRVQSDRANKPTFGTAFVIHSTGAQSYLLTCAHVVHDVGGPDNVRVGEQQAKVIALGDPDGLDLAVLEVGLLADKPALTLQSVGERSLSFKISGFAFNGQSFVLRPLRGTLGEQVSFEFRTHPDRVPGWDLKIEGDFNIEPGYSGSPLLDEITSDVIGVVSHREGGKKGLAISIIGLRKIWPDAPVAIMVRDGSRPVKDPACIGNPFGIMGKISDPEDFFDREEILRQVWEDLSKGCNRSLVGDSKIGKSSILLMLKTLGPTELKLPADRFIYLDMQNVSDEREFFDEVCILMGIQSCRGAKLERAVRGKRYFLFLDEIEKMCNPEHFSIEVRSELNGLADGKQAPLRLVIASRSTLSLLFPDSPEQTSPLSGNCPQLNVPSFSDAITRKFVAQRLRGTGVNFTNAEVDELFAVTGGHPAKLQREAERLFARYVYAK